MASSTTPIPRMASDATPIPKPILTTPRCLIRPYHASDISAVAHHANNPNVARNLRPHFPSPYTLADAEEWVNRCCAEEKPLSFAICEPQTNTLVGSIDIRFFTGDEARTAELGYWLGEEFWGRGVMTDAARGFARWALENFAPAELERLEAHVYSVNKGSARVVTKAGFVFEGTRRRAGFKHGASFDILMFGLVRDDLKAEEGVERSVV